MRLLILLMSIIAVQVASAFYWVSFSGEEQGDDRYADDTPLLTGECYAILLQKKTASFAGFKANGELVDQENCTVLEFLSGKDGAQRTETENGEFAYCAPFKAIIQNNDYRSDCDYLLVALDTRVYRDGEYVVGGVDVNGKPQAVNAYTVIISLVDAHAITQSTNPDAPEPTQIYADTEDGVAKVDSVTALPDDVQTPIISGITIVDDMVMITIANTEPYLAYGLISEASVSEVMVSEKFVGDFKQGAKSVSWQVPMSSSGFFKVKVIGR